MRRFIAAPGAFRFCLFCPRQNLGGPSFAPAVFAKGGKGRLSLSIFSNALRFAARGPSAERKKLNFALNGTNKFVP